MRGVFKRTKDERGLCDRLMLVISVPLGFLRDFSTPMGEEDAWNRNRAAIIPITLVISFFYLNGDLDDVGKLDGSDDPDATHESN